MGQKIGIVLLNMGGPEKEQDVAPFLYNLFSDRQIIRLGPRFLQKPLAWYIARKRAPVSVKTYRKIGGGSPLVRITGEQAAALQTALQGDGDYTVVSAMRYWQPTAMDALKTLDQQGFSKIIALPLYPHFSCATSGSSLSDLRDSAARLKSNFDITEIHGWPDNPLYVQCFAENIKKGLAAFPALPAEDIEIVYSAHSLPVSFIDEGDPYLEHLHITIAAIEKITGWPGKLCFQSRSGPVEWLAPSTPEMLDKLAEDGCKNILMVPISFVSDHVETLYEINMLYREMAEAKGMQCFPCQSLNTNPVFIQSLRQMVLAHS